MVWCSATGDSRCVAAGMWDREARRVRLLAAQRGVPLDDEAARHPDAMFVADDAQNARSQQRGGDAGRETSLLFVQAPGALRQGKRSAKGGKAGSAAGPGAAARTGAGVSVQ